MKFFNDLLAKAVLVVAIPIAVAAAIGISVFQYDIKGRDGTE